MKRVGDKKKKNSRPLHRRRKTRRRKTKDSPRARVTQGISKLKNLGGNQRVRRRGALYLWAASRDRIPAYQIEIVSSVPLYLSFSLALVLSV